MKKRLLALLLCTALVTSLTGCESLLHKTEDSTVSDTADAEEEEEEEEENTQDDGGEDTGDIDESLIPILPEISEADVTAEPMEEDGRLNIVFFGDSQFENGTATGDSIPELVAGYTHARVYNLGMGGTCAALTQYDSTDPDNWDNRSFVGVTGMLKGDISRASLEGRPQLEVMESIDVTQVDYYIISYGLNDFLNGIRAHEEGKERDIRTYYGALSNGVGTLRTISPNAQIIMCTPCYTQFFNAQGVYLGDSHIHDFGIGTLNEYARQASHVVDGRGLLLDAAFDSMFNLNSNNAEAYLMDGVHLTPKGREVYALALSYIIAKDRGWTDRELERIDIDQIDLADDFLEDIPDFN